MNEVNDYFLKHLKELRSRLIISFLTAALFSTAAYFFIQPLSRQLVAPLFRADPKLATLVYTNLTEALFSYIKLSILVGIAAASPVIVYEAWMFVSPGLRRREKRQIFLVVFLASTLFTCGVLFSYFIVLPEMLSFFMGFARQNLRPLPRFGLYLTFVARNALAFGLAFEVPFLMAAAAKIGLVDSRYFRKHRLYAYIVMMGLAIMLTAGDIFSALLLTVPLGLLYETGIWIGALLGKKKSPGKELQKID